MRIVHDDLHGNAMCITGAYPERLELAEMHAADAGLAVWFCAFTNGLRARVA
jgi:hypothetical protein